MKVKKYCVLLFILLMFCVSCSTEEDKSNESKESKNNQESSKVDNNKENIYDTVESDASMLDKILNIGTTIATDPDNEYFFQENTQFIISVSNNSFVLEITEENRDDVINQWKEKTGIKDLTLKGDYIPSQLNGNITGTINPIGTVKWKISPGFLQEIIYNDPSLKNWFVNYSDDISSTESSSKPDSSELSEPDEPNRANDSKKAYVLEDEVIVDTNDCAFTIKKIDEDNIWGFTLKVLLENKTLDKNLMFAIDDVSINGYVVNPIFASSVAPGKKENTEINFSDSDLENSNITSVDEIEFVLRIYDADNLLSDNIVYGTYTVYPTGLSAKEVVIPERRKGNKEQVIFDDENVTFIIIEPYQDDIWGYSLKCFIENKTDKKLMFAMDDVSVNGYMIDPFWAESIPAGKKSITSVSFSDRDFEENGITQVSSVEFKMRVYNYDDMMEDNYVDKVFTYKP